MGIRNRAKQCNPRCDEANNNDHGRKTKPGDRGWFPDCVGEDQRRDDRPNEAGPRQYLGRPSIGSVAPYCRTDDTKDECDIDRPSSQRDPRKRVVKRHCDGPWELNVKYRMRFNDGVATVSLEATLLLPQAPLSGHEALADKSQSPALDQIEALLQVALSELVFGRSGHAR